MASLMGILTTASLAAFIISGHLLGFKSPPMHSIILGLVMLAASALVGNLRLGRTTPMDYGRLIFFLLAWAGIWTSAPGAPRFVLAHPEAGLFASLVVCGALPLILGREPFTTVHSSRRAPKQVWNTPAFIAINRRLSWIWVGLFLACLASTLAPMFTPALDGPAARLVFLGIIPVGLLLGAGLPLDRRYPDSYLRRHGLPSFEEQAKNAPGPNEPKSSAGPDPRNNKRRSQ